MSRAEQTTVDSPLRCFWWLCQGAGDTERAEDEEVQEAADLPHMALEEKIEQRTAELSPEQKAQSGVVVSVGHSGKLYRAEGLIRDEDRQEAA